MSTEKKELKESLEMLKAVEVVSVKGVKILKGGVGPEDIPTALELLGEFNVVVEGFKGADQIDDELKDLDDSELMQLGVATYGVYKAVKAELKK